MQQNLLVLSVYGPDQAGTRLRACQYERDLRREGLSVSHWSFLSAADSRAWFREPSRLARSVILLRSLLRVAVLVRRLRRADVVLVLREALPVASAVVERAAARRARLVWDVDDAIWTDYPRLFGRWVPGRLRRSERKYQRIATLADEVWAGSDVLADWCRQHATQVVVVPTVVDVPVMTTPRVRRERSVGWVGSASTALFLEEVLPALAAVPEPVTVRCVGATRLTVPAPLTVSCLPWSEQAETELLETTRVGLYPMSVDHALVPGKAGLKAVLYMAHGLPCVVTPTETVAGIVRDGVDGLHARTPDEWRQAVRKLLDDDAAWDRMSAAAHARAQEHYSLRAWGPRLAGRLADLARRAV